MLVALALEAPDMSAVAVAVLVKVARLHQVVQAPRVLVMLVGTTHHHRQVVVVVALTRQAVTVLLGR